MPTNELYDFVKAIIAKDFQARKQSSGAPNTGEPLIITLSRDYGALGEQVAQGLSECLGIPLFDQEILDKVAQRAKVARFKFEAHDENASAGVSTFLYSLLTGTAAELETYRNHLYEVIRELGGHDGLLVGRGAHLILRDRKIFRIRIVGSRLICAKRVATESKLDPMEAERLVYEINNKRHKSVQNLFADSFEHASLEYAKNFDLVINTDHIPPQSAVAIVVLALQQSGFDVQSRVGSVDGSRSK